MKSPSINLSCKNVNKLKKNKKYGKIEQIIYKKNEKYVINEGKV